MPTFHAPVPLRLSLLLTAVTLATAIAALPAPASAQSAAKGSTPAARAEARRLLREGSKAFTQGQHAAALEKFERALQIFPSARIQYNIGQALRELRRPVEAVEAFETFTARAERISSTERRATAAALKELEPQVSRLTITTSVPDVEVTVDGRTRGKTPLPGHLVLAPGTHEILLGRAGYQPLKQTITLAGGDQRKARYDLIEVQRPRPPEPPPIVFAPPTTSSSARDDVRQTAPLPPAAPPVTTSAPETAPLVDARSVPAPDGGDGWRSQTVVGVSLLVVSAASAVGAGVLMAGSWSQFNKAKDECRAAGTCADDADNIDSRVLWSKLLVGAAALTGVGGAATLMFTPAPRPGDVAAGGWLLTAAGTF